jgi:imidazolonepropionase
VNGARALGLDDRGVLDIGKRADFVVWNVEHPAELVYWIGGDLAHGVHIAGQRVT